MDSWALSGFHKLPKDTAVMLKKVDEQMSGQKHPSFGGKMGKSTDMSNTI